MGGQTCTVRRKRWAIFMNDIVVCLWYPFILVGFTTNEVLGKGNIIGGWLLGRNSKSRRE